MSSAPTITTEREFIVVKGTNRNRIVVRVDDRAVLCCDFIEREVDIDAFVCGYEKIIDAMGKRHPDILLPVPTEDANMSNTGRAALDKVRALAVSLVSTLDVLTGWDRDDLLASANKLDAVAAAFSGTGAALYAARTLRAIAAQE